MVISGVNRAASAYSGSVGSTTKRETNESSSAGEGSSTKIGSEASIVTLSDGQTSSVKPNTSTLASTPLAVAWAPQMFVQAHDGKDQKLTSDELAAQLNRVGVSAEDAKKLFETFDTSKDGTLSMDEYVKGVTANFANDEKLFGSLVNSYIHDAQGSVDGKAMNDFLSKGLAAATQYALMSGQRR